MILERQFIKDALYNWVDAVVKENGRTDEVIWYGNNGPRPIEPFITINIIGSKREGSPCYTYVNVDENGNDKQFLIQPCRKSLTMYGFGEDSYDLLQTIYDSIFLTKYRDMLHKKGLVIPQALDIVDTTTQIDNELSLQANFDFYVTYMRVITDKPGWIEHVIIERDIGGKIWPSLTI